MNDYTFEQLLWLLPLSGQWHLWKTTHSDSALRYCAKWEETIGARCTSIAVYGETPRMAMERLVAEIRGPVKGD